MSVGAPNRNVSSATQDRYDAFLSHNAADKPAVEALAVELERRGISCWLDTWTLVPGEPWQPAVEQALGQCRTCVVFFGPHGLGPWHNEEMRLALQRRASSLSSAEGRKFRVLPVILPGGKRARESDLPGFLQGTTWVEFRSSLDDEKALHRLVCGIEGRPPKPFEGLAIPQGACPYLGLKPFQPEDAPLFFGRTAKVQELVERLRANFGTAKEERFLVLIGASGSGKSSLAQAGLIPAIRAGQLPESQHWLQVRFRPGQRPWENLQVALCHHQQIASRIAALSALITRPEDEQRWLHLTAGLALQDKPESHRLFVLIDQFEELFTECNDEATRRQLIENVLYATNIAEGRTNVVLTMRADFYGQCATYAGLRAAVSDHQSLIGPLSEDELREVIETPAQRAGGEIEPGLMELLLADMKGQAGGLPFLEHALFKLWEQREGRRLTAKAYRDMGRLGGALDAHAEGFFTEALTTEERRLCQQILVDLVRPGEGSVDTKKRVLLNDVAPTEPARAVLKKLADARLVITDQEAQAESAQAELAHEALIGGWRRLGQWVNENREVSRLKQRLLDGAADWQRNGRRADFLYRGAQLALAEERFGPSGESLPQLGKEFLAASVAERRCEQEERQRQQQRRQRVLTAAALTFGLLAITTLWQKGEAERQARRARLANEETRQVASQAHVSLARDLHQAGNDTQALAHLAQALRLNPKNDTGMALTSVLLSQRGWAVPLAALTLPKARRTLTPEPVESARFSEDGRRVLTVYPGQVLGLARLWDATTGNPIGKMFVFTGGRIASANLGEFGERVLTIASEAGTALLWDVATEKRIGQPIPSEKGTARLWDVATGQPIGQPLKLGDSASSVQLAGERVLTKSEDGTARLWDVATGQPIGQPLKIAKSNLSPGPQFSPDDRRLLTASEDGAAQLWDAQTGQAIGKPLKHRTTINWAQFSAEGKQVFTLSQKDGTVRLWDAATSRPIGQPLKLGDSVSSVEFSPDGRRVLTMNSFLDGQARLWDATTGHPIGQPLNIGKSVSSVHFSPDSQRMVIVPFEGLARLWDVQTATAIGEPLKHEGEVTSVEFSPDGQRVLTVSSKEGTVRLWDAQSGTSIGEPLRHPAGVGAAEFSPDGRRVLTVAWDGQARLWDPPADDRISEPLQHGGKVTSAQFSPDGQRLTTVASESQQTVMRQWDLETDRPISETIIYGSQVSTVQFSPDGQRVVTVSEGRTAQLWNAATGHPIGQPLKHEGKVTSVQFSPDGQRVATASEDGKARLWDAKTGSPIGVPLVHGDSVTSADFSPDGQRVVTASWDTTARIWDAQTGSPIGVPLKHEQLVTWARFSPGGQQVVTTSWDGKARFWDTATGKEVGEPLGHGESVTWARFSPDGQRLLTLCQPLAGAGGTVWLWDAATHKLISKPSRPGARVTSAEFSPDGRRIVTASEDHTVQLWDAATGKEIGVEMRQEGPINSALLSPDVAQFSPDGQRLVTSSDDATAQLWDVPAISDKPNTKDVLLLADLAEATAGIALQNSGQMEIVAVLSPEQVKAKQAAIAAALPGPGSKLTPLQRLLKWSVSKPMDRTISPLSELTLAKWLDHRIKEGTLQGLRAAMRVDPASGRLAAHYGKALASFALESGTGPDDAQRARSEAEFQTRRALKLSPNDEEVKELCSGAARLLH